MPFTAGVYTLPTGNPVVTATTIQSSWANNTLSDIATALSSCLLKDGTQIVTANIPFSGFRLTGIGAATANTDAIQAQQIVNNSMTALTSVSGSNTIVGTATPIPAAYALGQMFEWIQATTNTAAATLNVSSLGAFNLYKNSPGGIVACIAGDFIAGNTYIARYDTAGADQFVVINPSIPDTPTTALTATGTIQTDALEVTNRMNVFSTVASGTGAKLSSISGAGFAQSIYNGGANVLHVYPDSGSKINSLATNGSMLLATSTACRFERVSATQWIGNLSA